MSGGRRKLGTNYGLDGLAVASKASFEFRLLLALLLKLERSRVSLLELGESCLVRFLFSPRLGCLGRVFVAR